MSLVNIQRISAWRSNLPGELLRTIDGNFDALNQPNGFFEASVLESSAVALTTVTAANVTTLTLPPGEYLIWAWVNFRPNAGTTSTRFVGGVHTTSATLPGADSFQEAGLPFAATASQLVTVSVLPFRLRIVTKTTYYLVAESAFAVSTMVAWGKIVAWKI